MEGNIVINIEDFDKVEMRAGTVIEVKDNKNPETKHMLLQSTLANKLVSKIICPNYHIIQNQKI